MAARPRGGEGGLRGHGRLFRAVHPVFPGGARRGPRGSRPRRPDGCRLPSLPGALRLSRDLDPRRERDDLRGAPAVSPLPRLPRDRDPPRPPGRPRFVEPRAGPGARRAPEADPLQPPQLEEERGLRPPPRILSRLCLDSLRRSRGAAGGGPRPPRSVPGSPAVRRRSLPLWNPGPGRPALGRELLPRRAPRRERRVRRRLARGAAVRGRPFRGGRVLSRNGPAGRSGLSRLGRGPRGPRLLRRPLRSRKGGSRGARRRFRPRAGIAPRRASARAGLTPGVSLRGRPRRAPRGGAPVVIAFEARACSVLYNLLRSSGDHRPFLLPANVCPVVPLTFRKAGRPFE